MDNKIIIQKIPRDYVMRWDHLRLNTNNLWERDKLPRPSDYLSICDKFSTKNWIYKFHPESTIKTLVLDKEDIEWLTKAQQIGQLTRKWSNLFQDELEELLQKYNHQTHWISHSENGWFIRTPRVSLKFGQFGPGPYHSLENVIKSLVSSTPTHLCFKPGCESLTLYFMPFQPKLDSMKEFRIFVKDHKITAISQQSLHRHSPWLNSLYEKGKLEEMITHKILEPYEKLILPKMKDYLDCYTMDFALIGDELDPYFIEPNSFGRNYPAGSSLFDWDLDDKILNSTNDDDTIYFRFTHDPEYLTYNKSLI
tara:strand:+ start:294 stop:1220 length:927 start_codon:yes stop_codon:yes gene_type:complete